MLHALYGLVRPTHRYGACTRMQVLLPQKPSFDGDCRVFGKAIQDLAMCWEVPSKIKSNIVPMQLSTVQENAVNVVCLPHEGAMVRALEQTPP